MKMADVKKLLSRGESAVAIQDVHAGMPLSANPVSVVRAKILKTDVPWSRRVAYGLSTREKSMSNGLLVRLYSSGTEMVIEPRAVSRSWFDEEVRHTNVAQRENSTQRQADHVASVAEALRGSSVRFGGVQGVFLPLEAAEALVYQINQNQQ